MPDYEPIDLSGFCNARAADCFPDRDPAVGAQTFHGLPFRIGAGRGKPCFIAFGPDAPLSSMPVAIPVMRRVHTVVFAHALLESLAAHGDLPGREVARYMFALEGGDVEEVPIRDRLEVDALPHRWGHGPFLAVPDMKDTMYARYEGRWEDVGLRQTEAAQGSARDYYLWAWRNPRPETPLTRVEIMPTGATLHRQARFMVAAITLGLVDEEPFRRTAAVPVKLSLLRPEDAEAPAGSLQVEVDRGVAGYPYPLAAEGVDAFMADPQKGWGEPRNPTDNPAYVDVAAIPSATVTVKRGDKPVAHARWGDIESKGVVETPGARFELADTGRNWVHTTVLDADTGEPLPCRVHFRTPDGIPYAPHGHHGHVNSDLGSWHIDVGGDVRLGRLTYAYIDGGCQGWLPRGTVIVDVARGYEYEPLRQAVDIKPGQRELTLRIRRRHDMNAERWYAGDTHVHFLSTQGALLEAAAEGVNCVNLMQSQWGHLFTSTEEFTGRPAVSPGGNTIVWASQENRQHLLGHMSLLGLKEPVMPWCSDGPSEAEMGGNMETTLSRWADACHAQGGTVVLPHFPVPNGEPAALIATGRVDAVEMLAHDPYFHLEYYRYLNGGYRLPLVGGTDKMDSGVPVGLYRTYAWLPPDEPFSYESWCAALRAGRTFMTSGPLLRLTANGEPVGSTLTLGKDGGTVEVEASATCIFPIHSLELVHNGRVVASTEEAAGARELRLQTSLTMASDGWLCARCAGPGYTAVPHRDSWGRGIMAHTSPVYLACGEQYALYSQETMQYMLTLIDGSLQYVRRRAPQWKPGTVTHHHAAEDHQAYLEEPFRQALAAVHKRMHERGLPH